MKKILSLIIISVLCLGILTGCAQIEGLLGQLGIGGSGEQQPPVEYNLPRAAEYISTLYKGTPNEEGIVITQSDFNVVGQCRIAAVPYTVNWSTDNELVKAIKNEDGSWTIDVTSDSEEAYDYKLTATIVAGDNTSTTVEFNFHVNAYNLSSFDEYMAAVQDDVVTVEGIVVAMNAKSLGNSRNHLFLADANVVGGYYIYQMDVDPVEAGIKVGMTVSVTGPVSPYSGMQEIKGGTATIIDSSIKEYAPVDITEKFAAGESLKNYVGLPVTVKGVTIGSQDLSTSSSQYLYFELNGVKGYVRTYVTDFPTTLPIVVNEDKSVSSPAKDAIDAAHAEHFGWTANTTGILILYNSNPYLIPMGEDCFEYLELIQKTDAEKVASEKEGLTLESSINADKVLDLLVAGKNYPEVSISWACDNENFVIADGKATVTVPDTAVTVKVTATFTCGEATDTKEFEIKLSKEITSIVDALAIGAAKEHNTYTDGKYMIAGIIKEVYNTTYGNMYLVDEYGNQITVYGTYSADGSLRYDKIENAPKAGDYVVILGVLGQYSNTAQMKNGWILSSTSSTTIGGAIEIGNSYEKNNYSEDKYMITGEITELQSDKYGNVIIKDAEGNSILVYGLYSANGATRYDSMEVKPVVGDTITVLGILGKYNDAQMKNGWLLALSAKATDTPADPENPGEGNEGADTPSAPVVTDGKYVFANYTAGEQYATETHKLSDTVSLSIADCHLTSQLRIYFSEVNDYNPAGRKGSAVFSLTSAAKKFVVSAGGKTGKIAVYGSTDGENWTALTTLEPTSTYTEYEIALGDAAYTFLKLEAVDAQARVDYVIIQQ